MIPFRRSKPENEVTLTSDAYRRWLRAHRPPLTWFLKQTVVEQETMALLGDECSKDIALAVGFAVADPAAAQAGIGAEQGDLASEEVLAQRIASGLIGKLMQRQKPAQPEVVQAPLTTFGGFGERKTPKQHTAQNVAPPTFMGANPTGDPDEVIHE